MGRNIVCFRSLRVAYASPMRIPSQLEQREWGLAFLYFPTMMRNSSPLLRRRSQDLMYRRTLSDWESLSLGVEEGETWCILGLMSRRQYHSRFYDHITMRILVLNLCMSWHCFGHLGSTLITLTFEYRLQPFRRLWVNIFSFAIHCSKKVCDRLVL